MNVRCAYFCKGLSTGTGTHIKTQAGTTNQALVDQALKTCSAFPVRDHGLIGGLI